MIKLDTLKSRIVPRLRLARMELKAGWREAQEINRENNVFKDIKELFSDVKEAGKNGDVHTAGVSDKDAKQVLDTSKSGLEAYAKANNINITFYTPQKPSEYRAAGFEKPIEITVTHKGGLTGSDRIESKVIDGDIDKITSYTVSKLYKDIPVESSKEEPFLKRVYRTISELKSSTEKE